MAQTGYPILEMSVPQSTQSERLVSLDAFRGATIALMVLVNTAGDGATTYGPLQHAEWHGWTLTDCVFPSFLWIVGLAMTLSLGKRLARGDSHGPLILSAARRAAILFGLGLFLYAIPDFDLGTQRILGVLQRIAICYFLATVIYLKSTWKTQIYWVVGLLATYWALMTLVPVPGYGAGRLDVEGNLAHYVDKLVLGSHNYRWTKTWDPEGLVSTIPALATALLGALAAAVVRLKRSLEERTMWLLLAGNALLAAGLVCDIWLPINKKLWTSSFTLFMGGLDFIVLGFFLYLVDGLGWKRLVKPLVILGSNAIAIYMLSEVAAGLIDNYHWHEALYRTAFLSWLSPYNASLGYALAYTALNWLAAWGLYKKGWFLKV